MENFLKDQSTFTESIHIRPHINTKEVVIYTGESDRQGLFFLIFSVVFGFVTGFARGRQNTCGNQIQRNPLSSFCKFQVAVKIFESLIIGWLVDSAYGTLTLSPILPNCRLETPWKRTVSAEIDFFPMIVRFIPATTCDCQCENTLRRSLSPDATGCEPA